MIHFEDCPVGMFKSENGELCLKTEYGLDAYIVSTGERFWGGAHTLPDLRKTNVQPVEVVPVVHARWVHGVTLGHEWRKCSKCLVSQGIFGCFTYCPNCGAKMDGGKSDDA